MDKHVEFLSEYCGECCNGSYHCVTCHRNNELREQHAGFLMLKEFHELVAMLGSNPMFAMMRGGT